MTDSEINRRIEAIDKTISKIMMSRLPADTKVEMIRSQRAKRRELLGGSK